VLKARAYKIIRYLREWFVKKQKTAVRFVGCDLNLQVILLSTIATRAFVFEGRCAVRNYGLGFFKETSHFSNRQSPI
jgi:hypothetical protein